MARLTSRYRSQIIADVGETKNGKKRSRGITTEAWHAKHPVSGPVRTVGVSPIKTHEDQRNEY